ncbi:MAG: DUF2156 domain-containing protein [Archangiaceae bacterium]|nr:DUF2156 domain-containing protein [Archangiaceae bacterium]
MRSELVRQFGSDPIAYSTLQPGLRYFDVSYGYVAYARAAGFALTLGPPVCAPQDRAALIEAFARRVSRPVFFYLQRDAADLVKSLGGWRYRVAAMGADKVLSLARPLDDDAKVKSAVKKARKAKLAVDEVSAGRVDRLRIEDINRGYLEKSAVPVEMTFLNRPLAYQDDGMSRMFLLQVGGELLGYAVLDPWFEGGRPAGYLLNLLRFGKTSLWGVYYSAVALLGEKLKAEGVGALSLGFTPLGGVDSSGCSRVLSPQVEWMARKFAAVPYLQRLKEMKDTFPGETPQRYFVGGSPVVATTVLSLLRACGVPLGPIVLG